MLGTVGGICRTKFWVVSEGGPVLHIYRSFCTSVKKPLEQFYEFIEEYLPSTNAPHAGISKEKCTFLFR